MMVSINKWCFIISLVASVLTGDMLFFLKFAWNHPLFMAHLLGMSLCGFVGQIFIYKMIRNFKQHIVPFVITTRKIITVGISIIYFEHNVSPQQIIGIALVFGSVAFEFFSEIMKTDKPQ